MPITGTSIKRPVSSGISLSPVPRPGDGAPAGIRFERDGARPKAVRYAWDPLPGTEGGYNPKKVFEKIREERIYTMATTTMDIIRILLSVIIPPIGVFLQVGIGLHFWLNILLTLLGYVPGLIHAIWVIVKK